nr:MAG TPA: hypothetical protein [Caudoviricetes sp.]
MNRSTAFDIISRYKEAFCLNGEFSEALDVALKKLKPKSETDIYILQLKYGNIFDSDKLFTEEYYNYFDAIDRIAELRKKVVDKCNDATSEFEFLYREYEGRMVNATKDWSERILPFIFKGKICSFGIVNYNILFYKEAGYNYRLKRDVNIAKYVMSNVLKLA